MPGEVFCRKIKLHANKLGNGAVRWLVQMLQHGAEDKENGPVQAAGRPSRAFVVIFAPIALRTERGT